MKIFENISQNILILLQTLSNLLTDYEGVLSECVDAGIDVVDQVSCDWWRAGHVTTCSPLIGPGYSPLQFSDALYLATRGSAALLNMEHSLGALQPGHLADMLLVDMEGNIAHRRE